MTIATNIDPKNAEQIAAEFKLTLKQVQSTLTLLADGATVPFIARYRKEATNSLDEVAIAGVRDRYQQLRELDNRREAIKRSLSERNLITSDLAARIEAAKSIVELEDIYLPFRPKRQTRASIARDRGLEPLAEKLFGFSSNDPVAAAQAFVNVEKNVPAVADALSGARDIMAEWISEDRSCRSEVRRYWLDKSVFNSKVVKGKEAEGAKYKDYFDWQELAATAPSHRVLALFRGEKEGILELKLTPAPDELVTRLEQRFVKRPGETAEQVRLAVKDSYKRLLSPSMETELRAVHKDKADAAAIAVFADNLRQLLLAPPLDPANVLAIDPGFRTGCKVVCLNEQGKLLQHDVIFPHQSDKNSVAAKETLRELLRRYKIGAIAVGNGTAGRETEAFVRDVLKSDDLKDYARTPVILVNESGASIYSASEVAREEFPDQDITVRGAVSIGRRLMDPLAELVKIDPKSIGVGQYQHDVDQSLLKSNLDDVVLSCVNSVGVEVNTASKQLLAYVSGLGPQLAGNIVKQRNDNGPFKSRAELKKVPRLGPKAFEQAAGFLRIRDGVNPLDGSAVHPESYHVVEKMVKDLGCSVSDLLQSDELRGRIDLQKYVSESIGLPTLSDIVNELSKPGRDPRQRHEPMRFADGVTKLEDLKPEMRLPGIVTNVTAFGAFVDIGVHQDGLVHVSELADRFVKNPADVVKVQQRVTVTVLEVDIARRRISLSMKSKPSNADR
jgi:uncharacterized protein